MIFIRCENFKLSNRGTSVNASSILVVVPSINNALILKLRKGDKIGYWLSVTNHVIALCYNSDMHIICLLSGNYSMKTKLSWQLVNDIYNC